MVLVGDVPSAHSSRSLLLENSNLMFHLMMQFVIHDFKGVQMNVLMLGWEYPPHIAGGLGMACEGLTKGLASPETNITFVVPYLYGEEVAPHMKIVDSFSAAGETRSHPHTIHVEDTSLPELIGIPTLLKPYWNQEEYNANYIQILQSHPQGEEQGDFDVTVKTDSQTITSPRTPHYGADIYEEVSNFTYNVVQNLGNVACDVIHAHDWMTYPAGVALKRRLGKPLVVHVHSLEFDRSGSNANSKIEEIERFGLEAADAVITVSRYTKDVVTREYGIPTEKIHAVHNGIYPSQAIHYYRKQTNNETAKIILFLGRITFQKGPDYFVRAAAKVIPHVPESIFIMAGSGDMMPQMIKLVEELGISDHFEFPGFLRGDEVERIFSIADLYVMPSVSEPFGLSALEAINFDVPALISKQSGVSEVVTNSLKFDFWDVDRLADLIINGLIHEEMRHDMIEMARKELGGLRWDASAKNTRDIYEAVIGQRS
jgi:glycosyltransferase involved in cell wall biosynthesis